MRTGITLVESPHWKLKRQPFLLETSRPGVFAAGDVRSGSVNPLHSLQLSLFHWMPGHRSHLAEEA